MFSQDLDQTLDLERLLPKQNTPRPNGQIESALMIVTRGASFLSWPIWGGVSIWSLYSAYIDLDTIKGRLCITYYILSTRSVYLQSRARKTMSARAKRLLMKKKRQIRGGRRSNLAGASRAEGVYIRIPAAAWVLIQFSLVLFGESAVLGKREDPRSLSSTIAAAHSFDARRYDELRLRGGLFIPVKNNSNAVNPSREISQQYRRYIKQKQ